MNFSKTQRILLFASGLWFFGEGLLGPLFAVFTEKIGGDILDITWAWSLYLITSGLLYFLFGKILNKSKYKEEAMVFGYFLNTLFTFCYIFVHNSKQLFLLQIGFAFAEAISTPIWDSLFAKNLENPEDSFGWGVAGGQSHLISGIAIAVGGLITYYISFNTLFITMGIIQATATIIQARLLLIKK
ncbi:MAG: MFS transporter [Bacteroidota bacterium]|nr:MFS transporter [Bacteroidota bacterium]